MSISLFFELVFRALHIAWEWFYGCLRLNRIKKPIISIFGGHGLIQDSSQGKEAYAVAKQLVDKGFFVITGGGPGAMEAAHCGALEGGVAQNNGDSLGIGVRGVDEKFETQCFRHIIITNFFFVRKWLLTHFSKGVIIFPGGYGTADELFEVLNLLKLKRLPPMPVVLVGKNYWQPLVSWIDGAIDKGLIKQGQEQLFIVVDTADEIMQAINKI